MQSIVSVIIPVYNVERYIEECINSVINQTYTHLDIILVNDGSTDSSGKICDKFERNDTRIKVIHKSNGGLSQARNKGVEFAEGEYILFLDSDDYLEKDAIKILVKQAECAELDVVEFNARKFWQNGSVELIHKRRMYLLDRVVMKGEEYYLKSVEYDCFTAAACFKMVRKEILQQNKLFFKENRLHEDELWAPQLMLIANRVCYLDMSLYNYRMRDNSITLQQERTRNVLCYMQNCVELKKIFEEKVIEKSKREAMLDYLARQYMAALTIGNFSWEKVNIQCDRKFPISNSQKVGTRIAAILYLVSPKLYLYILQLLKRIYRNVNK